MRLVFEKGRYLRTVDSRPGRTIRIRGNAVGRHPHLSRLTPWPNARPRRQHPSGAAAAEPACHGQPPRRDDFSHCRRVIVATNNHYAYSTPNDREFACHDLVDRAIGYGFEGYSLDGTDLSACLEVIGGAVKRARAGRPPQLVVASVLRLSGHGEHDDASYVTEEIKREPFARDCLKVAEQTIADLKLADAETLTEWRKEAAMKVDEAIATAQKEAPPEGDKEDWCALSTRDLVDQVE
jgi:hypothetical protein